MGEIILKTGSLFESELPVLIHGVNTKGKFASGVARLIAHEFPCVKHEYLEKYDAEGWKLGDWQVVEVPAKTDRPTSHVVNLATQNRYGYDGKQYVDYDAVKICLEGVLSWAEESDLGVAMPRIGAGLGGGDWNRIFRILQDVVLVKHVTVEVWTP